VTRGRDVISAVIMVTDLICEWHDRVYIIAERKSESRSEQGYVIAYQKLNKGHER
jgi:hypothetical protein